MTRKQKRRRVRLLILAALLIALAVGAWIYLTTYYHADAAALETLGTGTVEVRRTDDRIDFIPADPVAGLIFYPGGKVEFTAYAPLMEACAERGVLCVLLRMPANLAVFDQNAADGVAADYPGVSRWYVGGHSLGGSVAAIYAAGHADDLAGVVLLAAFSTSDLSETDLQVLSVYGSEDGVMSAGQYASARPNLPDDTTELVIQGGCHAYFGSYGAQSGDGTPTITRDEQIRQTADAVAALAGAGALDAAA